MREEPTQALPREALTMWLCAAALQALAAWVAAGLLTSNANVLEPWLPIAVVAGGIASVAYLPRARHRRWRWGLDEEELDIVHGLWRVRRTIVPLTRIQHVTVERTGWTDAFGLVRLHAHTAAGATTIPGLLRAQADDVRDRILAQLRTPDDL